MAINPFSDLHVNELTSFSFTHILRQHSIIKWLAKWVATNQACVFLVEMDRTNKLFALNIHLAFFIVHVGFLVTQRVYRKKLSLNRQTAASGKKLFPRRKKIIFCSPTLNQFTNNHPSRCFVTFPFWEFIWRKNEFDRKIMIFNSSIMHFFSNCDIRFFHLYYESTITWLKEGPFVSWPASNLWYLVSVADAHLW